MSMGMMKHQNQNNKLFPLTKLSVFLFGATIAASSVTLQNIKGDFLLDYSQLGMLSLVRGVMISAFVVVSGFLAVAYGKKIMLTASMFMLALSLGALYIADSFFMLLLVFGSMGIALGIIEALPSPLVVQLDPGQTGKNLNILHAFFPIGMIVAAMFSGELLIHRINWRVPFAVISGAAIITGLLFLRTKFPEENKNEDIGGSLTGLFRNPLFWVFGLLFFLAAGTEGGITYWGASFIRDQVNATARSGAIGISLFAGLMAVSRFTTSRFTRRFGLEKIIILGAVLGIVDLTFLIISDSAVTSWFLLGVSGIAVGPFWPTILALAAKRIKTSSITLLLTLMAGFGITGYSAVPWFLGILADKWTLNTSFVLMILILGAVIFITAAYQYTTGYLKQNKICFLRRKT